MSKEMIPGLPDNGEFLFKVGMGCVLIIIVFFIYNLFSKMKEINNKIDSFLTETSNPHVIPESPNDVIQEIFGETETEKKKSNIDLSGVDSSLDLETIEE
mgnify:FL=1|tara:strand:- start:1606 stop:1905 length:300 start_codon:yes stop_codon:yes gene_type:complete